MMLPSLSRASASEDERSVANPDPVQVAARKRRRKRSRSSKDETNDDDDNDIQEHNVEAVTESTPQTEITSYETKKAQHDKGEAHEDANENEKEEEKPEGENDNANNKPGRKRKRKGKMSKQQDPSASQEEKDDFKTTAKLSSLDLTVFVQGIPFDCSEEDGRPFFESNDCEDILKLRLPR
jgi:hypothetical protein